jgi:Zn-dependent M28 family amino/carboxypeptidase
MYSKLLAAVYLAAIPSLAAAQPGTAITPDDLRRHIEVLASDELEGRKPGTQGETKTIRYISSQLQRLGLEPAAPGGGWYQPVGLVERAPATHQAEFRVNGRSVQLGRQELILTGRSRQAVVADVPLVFAGYGSEAQPGSLAGAAVLILYSEPPHLPLLADRLKAVRAAGARAIIVIHDRETPWRIVEASYRHSRPLLATEPVAEVEGGMSYRAAATLLREGRARLEDLAHASSDPGFRPVPLDARVSLRVTTNVHSYTSNNVVGRLRGSGRTGESVLFLGHWDHLGICRPPGAPDRICNGAVDNASGIATLIEVAARLARGRRPERDILIMATTAEEMGLLGAIHFAANPTVPLRSIVAAINVDTVAVHRAGGPVSITGRGFPALDRLVAETAAEFGRPMDDDSETDAFIARQDGWAFARLGVPAAIVGGAFSDMGQLNAFLSGPYHQPEDDLRRPLVLDGAAEDADLLVALGRKLADPRRYQPRRR